MDQAAGLCFVSDEGHIIHFKGPLDQLKSDVSDSKRQIYEHIVTYSCAYTFTYPVSVYSFLAIFQRT